VGRKQEENCPLLRSYPDLRTDKGNKISLDKTDIMYDKILILAILGMYSFIIKEY
jgi:hypothetical protein